MTHSIIDIGRIILNLVIIYNYASAFSNIIIIINFFWTAVDIHKNIQGSIRSKSS